MKAQQAVTVVKEVTASAPNVLKALGCGTFFGLVVPAFAGTTLDAFVNAAVRFSDVIRQQLVMVQSHPAPAEFAEKTVAYAKAKTVYFTALREEMPELINSATRGKLRPLQLDNFIATFAVAGEKQEKVADEKTLVFLERFLGNPDIEKARAEFKRAQKIEEAFQKDFDGLDFTIYSRTTPFACSSVRSPWPIFFAGYTQNSAHDAEFRGGSITTWAEIRGGQSSPELTDGRCFAGYWNNLTFCCGVAALNC